MGERKIVKHIFCDCCGQELMPELDMDYRVAFYDREERKQKTVLHLCEKDIKKVRYMKFVPQKNCRIRKVPKWYNVIEYNAGKQKSLFQIPEWNLDQILAINNAKKTLFTIEGKVYYTKEHVLGLVDGSIKTKGKTPEQWLFEFVQKLYNRQTTDEKAKYETKWHNNVGFNKPDAQFMSAMARLTFEGKELVGDQLPTLQKRFIKYAEQVANLVNEENGVE